MIAFSVLLSAACAGPDHSPESPQRVEIEPIASVSVSASAPDVLLVFFSRLRDGDASRAMLARLPPATASFGAAYSQSPSAFVSLGTLLTGRYASALPLCDLTEAGRENPKVRPWCASIPSEVSTLPEVFALYGYETTLITSDQVGAEIYAPLFAASVDVTRTDGGTDWSVVERELDGRLASRRSDGAERKPQLLVAVLGDLNEVVLREEVDAVSYSTAVDALSARLGPVLAASAGPRRRLTFLGGINGINLGEPSGFSGREVDPSAQDLLLDRTVHVPLAFYDSGTKPDQKQFKRPVELIDLFATVARLAEVTPPARVSDEDLLRSSEEGVAIEPEAYVEYGDMLALRRGPLLLTFRAFFHHGAALDPAVTEALLADKMGPATYGLHHVVRNPMQSGNMFGHNKQKVRSMRRRLRQIRQGEAAPGAGVLSTERLWKLRMTETKGYW